MSHDPFDYVEAKGLRSSGQTISEIAARCGLPEKDVTWIVEVLVSKGRASPAHPRGRGLKRKPTFKRGPSGLQLLQAAVR